MHLTRRKETFETWHICETVKKYQVNNPVQINVKVEQKHSNRLKMQTLARKMGFHKRDF